MSSSALLFCSPPLKAKKLTHIDTELALLRHGTTTTDVCTDGVVLSDIDNLRYALITNFNKIHRDTSEYNKLLFQLQFEIMPKKKDSCEIYITPKANDSSPHLIIVKKIDKQQSFVAACKDILQFICNLYIPNGQTLTVRINPLYKFGFFLTCLKKHSEIYRIFLHRAEHLILIFI